MQYTTEEMKRISLETIKREQIVYQEYLFAYVPFSKYVFYEHKLEKDEDIRHAIFCNRTSAKQKLIMKWQNSDAAREIAAFKLLGTDEEREVLNNRPQIDGDANLTVSFRITANNDNDDDDENEQNVNRKEDDDGED